MKLSDKTDKLMPAMAAAYEEIDAAFKTGRTHHIAATYADLQSVDTASRAVLTQHRLF